MIRPRKDHNLRPLTYLIGFIVSVALTIEAYLLAVKHSLSTSSLIGLLLGLAIAQFLIQMFFFLHLGDESQPRWRLVTFLSMLGVVLILVIGSLWIMHNLNYSHQLLHGSQQINKYLDSQDGL